MASPAAPDPEPSRDDDLALVQRILRGERRELARLSERLACIARILRVLNLKRGCALDDEELADLAQDVLVIAWRKLGEYQGTVALEGWAYGICTLELMNALRRKRRDGQARADDAAVDTLAATPAAAPWDYEGVHRGLSRIGPDEADVIRLKHFEALTFEEIGRRLGVSANTIKARYYRGLVDLKPLLRRREDHA